MIHEWRRDGYTISTDPARLDVAAIHAYLTTSYWAEGIGLDVVRRSLEHSVNFGLYDDADATEGALASLAGYARVITDRATFGYLGDVFVLEPHRGRGLSKFLMECVSKHPDLQGFRRWVLLTRDAHGLYRQYGYTGLEKPERYMERWSPNAYRSRT